MRNKKAKRIRKTNKFIKKFVKKFVGYPDISGFEPYSSLTTVSEKVFDYNSYSSTKNAYLSRSGIYYRDSETGKHRASEYWSIFYKDSGKIDYITNLNWDRSKSKELGDTFLRIGLKNYKKFCKAWKKKSYEYDKIITEDGISHLSSSNEAYNLINWLDDLPGTQKGEYSSYISFGNDEYYYA